MNGNGRILLGVALAILAVALIFNFAVSDGAITGDSIPGFNIASESADGRIVVPVKAHIVRDISREYTSFRDEANVLRTFSEANRIWEQADIYFDVQEVVQTNLETGTIPAVLAGSALEIYNAEGFDDQKVNVFFAGSLDSLNGLALANINSALIADFTTVNDFRTTAHELGHLLGLRHITPSDRLMSRGKNGEIIDNDYIQISRAMALRMLQNNFYFDTTEILISGFKDYGNLIEADVEVFMKDNNNNADADGGKISFRNAQIIEVREVDWESNCGKKDEFDYECIIVSEDGSEIQWFNFVHNDADRFSFTIRFPSEGTDSLLILEETGGMECGAYYQTAQTGPYTGYPDGTAGLDCSTSRTSVNNDKVSVLGGFPVRINLQELFESK